jgi:hypothetical protein
MANGDVDAINERLNGLVSLLQVVGIDGVNADALVEEQRRAGGGGSPTGGGGHVAPLQSSDTQILALIKKLQLAQADSPEIIAALKSPELRALASLAAQKQASYHQSQEPKKASPALDDVMDDDDNYPKIGPGYSDDISVVSDMTTPTVMTRQQVTDEEHYREVNGGPGALPPLLTMPGGPAQPARPSMGVNPMQRHGGKTKNMVEAVRPTQAHRVIAKSGGAAAQRRLNYQMAMTKLQSGVPSSSDPSVTSSPRKTQKDAFAPASPTPSQQTPMEFPSMADGSGGKNVKKEKEKLSSSSKKSKKTALADQEVSELDFEGTEPIRTPTTSATSSGSTNSGNGRKKSPTPVTNNIDWGIGDTGGWQAFDIAGSGSNGQDIFVDNDGFFPDDAFASNDVFPATATSPTRSSSVSSSAKSPKQRPTNGSVRKAVPSKKLSAGRLKKEGDAKRSEKPGKKKNRSRASLTM